LEEQLSARISQQLSGLGSLGVAITSTMSDIVTLLTTMLNAPLDTLVDTTADFLAN